MKMFRFSISILCLLNLNCVIYAETPDEWPLKWFPRNPNALPEQKPIADVSQLSDSGTTSHRVMGQINSLCDDGKTNLTLDDNQKSHLCLDDKILHVDPSTEPRFQVYDIPERYVAIHRCMSESIDYDYQIPTYGTHRGLWPRYGEYSYLPVQRWLHTLEHGGIVTLYHPCAPKDQVDALKTIVASCLFRHVITPSERVSSDRPFALVAWGALLEMATVNKETVVGFITSHALKGPEQTSNDGQFDVKLIKAAEIISDHDDYQLCPKFVFKTRH